MIFPNMKEGGIIARLYHRRTHVFMTKSNLTLYDCQKTALLVFLIGGPIQIF
jgi:hypothetical protein